MGGQEIGLYPADSWVFCKRYYFTKHSRNVIAFAQDIALLYGSSPWDFVASPLCAYEPGATVIYDSPRI